PQIEPRVWERIAHRTTVIIGESPGILAQVAAHGPFDFALVDGDHTYEGVRRDVHAVLPLVARDGHILCHDGDNDQVARALGEFTSEVGDRVVDCGLLTREGSTGPDGPGRPGRDGGVGVCGAADSSTGPPRIARLSRARLVSSCPKPLPTHSAHLHRPANSSFRPHA